MYKYKLKEQPESVKPYQQQRLQAFDEISDLMAQLKVLLDDAQIETEQYYKNNPTSYSVVYSTDLAKEYIEDVIKMFRQDED
jgi:pyruvate dehydrogenase complex dehydrogenase (E1) component